LEKLGSRTTEGKGVSEEKEGAASSGEREGGGGQLGKETYRKSQSGEIAVLEKLASEE